MRDMFERDLESAKAQLQKLHDERDAYVQRATQQIEQLKAEVKNAFDRIQAKVGEMNLEIERVRGVVGFLESKLKELEQVPTDTD